MDEVADNLELALIHIYYARAELQVSHLDAATHRKLVDHLDAAIMYMQYAPPRGKPFGEDVA